MTIKLPLQRVTIYGDNNEMISLHVVYSSDVTQLEAAYGTAHLIIAALKEDYHYLKADRDGLRKKVCKLQDENYRLTNQIHELMRGGIK